MKIIILIHNEKVSFYLFTHNVGEICYILFTVLLYADLAQKAD